MSNSINFFNWIWLFWSFSWHFKHSLWSFNWLFDLLINFFIQQWSKIIKKLVDFNQIFDINIILSLKPEPSYNHCPNLLESNYHPRFNLGALIASAYKLVRFHNYVTQLQLVQFCVPQSLGKQKHLIWHGE